MLSATDPRVAMADQAKMGKIVGVGYGIFILCCLTAPHKVFRYPLTIVPNLFLLLGLLSPIYLPGFARKNCREGNANRVCVRRGADGGAGAREPLRFSVWQYADATHYPQS